MAKILGAVLAAGTQVKIREGQSSIQPSTFGGAAYAGILERGPTDELIFVSGGIDAEKKIGKYTSGSVLPDAVFDYFKESNGAGFVALIRLTDGTEKVASLPMLAQRSAYTPIGRLDAKNGGKWGGSEYRFTGTVSDEAVDITETTVVTGLASTWNEDQLAGGSLVLAGVSNKSYKIVGNTAAGVISVASDQTMATDLAGGGDATNDRYYIELDAPADKGLKVQFGDSPTSPSTHFSISVFLDGEADPVLEEPHLSTDPDDRFYWVDRINDRADNYYVTAVDTWTGAHVANVRPVNHYGTYSSLTERVLTADVASFEITNSPTGGNPTFAIGTTTDAFLSQVITLTMTDATSFTAASDRFGDLGSGTLGSEFTPNNKWSPPFTVTAGATPLVAADTLTVFYTPFKPSALVNGRVYPHIDSDRSKAFRIISNDHKSVTVSYGVDMTVGETGVSEFSISYPEAATGGRDGHAGVTDADYQGAFDTETSLFNQAKGKGYGLLKFATPGVQSAAVQKAGLAYADANGHQFRYEVPFSTNTKEAVVTFLHDTLGKNKAAVATFQGQIKVDDPESPGKLKLVSSTGKIHGEEARIARDFGGYHEAQAGLKTEITGVEKVPNGRNVLDEEYLNPRGVGIIKKVNGRYVLWGNKTLDQTSDLPNKHQYETLFHYAHILLDNFDSDVFKRNDPTLWASLRSKLLTYFRNEYTKGALDNSLKFEEAFVLKIDSENNTAATQNAGDVHVDITVSIVNVAERIKFSIGKAGVTVSAA